MNLTNKLSIKNLLERHNAKPEKYLGQHFILANSALKKMIEIANIKEGDIIFEIGPGLGALTQELANTGANIIAIEKDSLMIDILKEILAEHKNIKIIQSDARNISLPIANLPDVRHRVKSGKDVDKYVERKKYEYKIVANLPYNVATFLIHQWLESEYPPIAMVLMIQKEVAQRIIAKPPHSNLLGISVQFYADAKIIDYVKKESFWPKPKVDAAIIRIIPRKEYSLINQELFFKVLKAGFSQPRKQLIGNLSKKLKLSRETLLEIFKNLNISGDTRAENLNLEQWQTLFLRLSSVINVIHK